MKTRRCGGAGTAGRPRSQERRPHAAQGMSPEAGETDTQAGTEGRGEPAGQSESADPGGSAAAAAVRLDGAQTGLCGAGLGRRLAGAHSDPGPGPAPEPTCPPPLRSQPWRSRSRTQLRTSLSSPAAPVTLTVPADTPQGPVSGLRQCHPHLLPPTPAPTPPASPPAPCAVLLLGLRQVPAVWEPGAGHAPAHQQHLPARCLQGEDTGPALAPESGPFHWEGAASRKRLVLDFVV